MTTIQTNFYSTLKSKLVESKKHRTYEFVHIVYNPDFCVYCFAEGSNSAVICWNSKTSEATYFVDYTLKNRVDIEITDY